MSIDTPENGSSYESWEEARRMAGLVSNISSLFTTAIRFLMKDAESGAKVLSVPTLYCLQRLLNSESFKAPVYYTALTFKTETVQKSKYLSAKDLANLFGPEELANVIGLLYLYRRVQRACDETEWGELSKLIHLHGELGGHVGTAIPKIGFAWGLLLGSIRHLALGLFLAKDKKNFVQYRRGIKIKKLAFDLEEEQRNWGCNHLQIASLLIQSLRLGSQASKAITTGLLVEGLPDKEMDIDSYRARILWSWILALRDTAAQPDITHRGDFYPLRQDLDRMIEQSVRLRKNGCTSAFFSRSKVDVSPQLTPCLFQGGGATVDTTTVETAGVSEDLKEQFDDAQLKAEEI